MTRSSDRGYQEGARARKALWIVLGLAVVLAVGAVARARLFSDWITIGREQTMNISGLARIDAPGADTDAYLIVHDNKLSDEARLAVLTLEAEPEYATLPWPTGFALPFDLEAVSPIPGTPELFLALSSSGTATLLEIVGDGVEVRGAFTLPVRPGLPNFEGFSVQRIGDRLVAAWGHRGAGTEAGQIFWGELDLETPAITGSAVVEFRVPFPRRDDPNTRHIADMRISTTGQLWIAAASDPGNDGPFVSAIYEAGHFRAGDGTIRFDPAASLSPFARYERKIEAIELTSDESAMVLGTDDEMRGSAIATLPLQ
jgi:hypothetical protein